PCFYRSSHPPDLHSFPTRRSSDLEHVQSSTTPQSVLLTGLARARGFRLDGYGVLFDVEFPSIRRSVAWTMRALERPDPELLAAIDRKSTRLNSSHRTISYAVFCLK